MNKACRQDVHHKTYIVIMSITSQLKASRITQIRARYGIIRLSNMSRKYAQYAHRLIFTRHFLQKGLFRKRATNYRALLRKMTCEDEASYDSTPPCIIHRVMGCLIFIRLFSAKELSNEWLFCGKSCGV